MKYGLDPGRPLVLGSRELLRERLGIQSYKVMLKGKTGKMIVLHFISTTSTMSKLITYLLNECTKIAVKPLYSCRQ